MKRLLPLLVALAIFGCGEADATKEEKKISVGQATAETCDQIKNEIQRKFDRLDNWDQNGLGGYAYMLAVYYDLCTDAPIEAPDPEATDG